MILAETAPLEPGSNPLQPAELPAPEPGPGEILIKVSACGVCHTELDEIEGRLTPPRLPVVPGHEVVGVVEKTGRNAGVFSPGTRVGVGWIHHSDGGHDENLSPEFRATGMDVNGGYAEYMTVSEKYAYPIPDVFTDEQAAPLLCAGAIGYRALKLALINNSERLGLTGFGGSAHLVLQLSRHLYPDTDVYVFARDESAREFARECGAAWAGDSAGACPDPLHAIVDTTPAWKPVVEAMRNLRPGGRLVINAIRKEDNDKDELLRLNYHEHLWREKEIKSVANITRRDIREFLDVAATIPIQPTTECYALEDANKALLALKFEPVRGAKVLRINP